jgi:hypothetical protein
MSDNLSPRQPLGGDLSAGNVVSAGLRIYRDRFKPYFLLALQASLWSLIPVYGWAKSYTLLAIISRLAYGEVIERPESVDDARQQVNPLLWNILAASLLVGLLFLSIIIGVGLFVALFFGILYGVLSNTFLQNSAINVFLVILGIVIFLVFLLGFVWLSSRFSVFELPMAIDLVSDPIVAIKRSWNLTKDFVWQLILISTVAFLIFIPFYVISYLLNLIVVSFLTLILTGITTALDRIIFSSGATQSFQLFVFITVQLISFAISLVMGAVYLPFWQAIKAVIYYDLRVRKEGLDLQIKSN